MSTDSGDSGARPGLSPGERWCCDQPGHGSILTQLMAYILASTQQRRPQQLTQTPTMIEGRMMEMCQEIEIDYYLCGCFHNCPLLLLPVDVIVM